ncbi:retrotransposon protein, putative, ty1-copia subclass [Tanacetum coccineum]
MLTVGHNAKKRNTFHSNWKGKATKGKSDFGSKRKAESEIAPTSDPKEAVCFYCNTKGHWKRSCLQNLKDLKDGKNPGEGHWTAVKNILKYLRNTKDMFLVYGGEEELRVTGYCDARSYLDEEFHWFLGVIPTVQDPIEIFYDNESVVALTKEPKDHEKSKHIERKYHFVQRKVEEGHVIVKHIRSEDNLADPLTKALAKSRHDKHAKSIGLKDNIKF